MTWARRSTPLFLAAVLVLALVASAALAQGRGRQGRGGMQMGVPGLQQHQLSTDQRNEIARIRTEARNETQRVRQDPNLNAQQRAERIAQIQQQTHDEVMNVLTEQQREEFNNWWSDRMQGRGAGRGAGPGAGMGMGMATGQVPGLSQHPLSQAQMNRIRDIRTNYAQRIANVRRNQNLSSQQRMDQIQQLRQQQHQEVMSVLTPEQQQEFSGWWSGRQPGGMGAGAGGGNMHRGRSSM